MSGTHEQIGDWFASGDQSASDLADLDLGPIGGEGVEPTPGTAAHIAPPSRAAARARRLARDAAEQPPEVEMNPPKSELRWDALATGHGVPDDSGHGSSSLFAASDWTTPTSATSHSTSTVIGSPAFGAETFEAETFGAETFEQPPRGISLDDAFAERFHDTFDTAFHDPRGTFDDTFGDTFESFEPFESSASFLPATGASSALASTESIPVVVARPLSVQPHQAATHGAHTPSPGAPRPGPLAEPLRLEPNGAENLDGLLNIHLADAYRIAFRLTGDPFRAELIAMDTTRHAASNGDPTTYRRLVAAGAVERSLAATPSGIDPHAQHRARLSRDLARHSQRDRCVLALRHLAGLGAGTVAVAMGLDEDTARSVAAHWLPSDAAGNGDSMLVGIDNWITGDGDDDAAVGSDNSSPLDHLDDMESPRFSLRTVTELGIGQSADADTAARSAKPRRR